MSIVENIVNDNEKENLAEEYLQEGNRINKELQTKIEALKESEQSGQRGTPEAKSIKDRYQRFVT